MPYNERKQPYKALNALALYSAALTVSCALWIALGLAVGMIEPYPVQESICGDETEQTDSYWECTTGSELDLTPIIEDEAQVTTAQERG
jgi:hypothetical protein